MAQVIAKEEVRFASPPHVIGWPDGKPIPKGWREATQKEKTQWMRQSSK